jgi:hypothetical protein
LTRTRRSYILATRKVSPGCRIRLVVWTAVALTIYFGYGYRHGVLGDGAAPVPAVEPDVAPPGGASAARGLRVLLQRGGGRVVNDRRFSARGAQVLA